LTDTTAKLRHGGVNRDGSHVQKQLAQKPNTLLGRIHLADTSTSVSRGIETTFDNRGRRFPEQQR
jgi:hypothetical protein